MGKAVKIVDFESKNGSDKPSLNTKPLEKIVNKHANARDKPVMVIAVGGVARSGKSFLLNLFVNYLTYLEENGSDEGWEDSDESIEGVNWAQSGTSVTHGILVWDKPFLIKTADGREIVIMLVDSQGTGDNRKSDVNLDTLIMYISLQLATVQALNIKSYLTSNDMFSLKLCADFADIDGAQASEGGHLFESLAFIIRDEQCGGKLGEDAHAFDEMNKGIENAELRSVGSGIRKAFKNITSFNMPYPGEKVTKASADDDDLSPQDLPRDFVNTAKEVIKKLCGFTASGCNVSYWPTGAQFLATFQTLKHHLENDELTKINSPADAFQDIILNKAFIGTQDQFRCAMEAVYTGDRLANVNSDEELEALYNEEVTKAKEHFHKAGRVHKKYEEMLQAIFDNTYSHLKGQYKTRMHLKKVEEENEETRLKVEQQAQEFQQQVAGLQEENKRREQQIEEEKRAQQEREQRHAAEVEQLKKDIEEAKNDEEMQKLREEIEAKNKEAERQREETERAKQERDQQMKELTEKIGKMEKEQREVEEKQQAEAKRLQENVKRELEERRRAEEEAAKKQKESNWMDNPVMKLFAGALTTAATNAMTNYFTGGTSSDGVSGNTSETTSSKSNQNLKSPSGNVTLDKRPIYLIAQPSSRSTPQYNPQSNSVGTQSTGTTPYKPASKPTDSPLD